MLISNHTLGFPRIGFNRELKIAQEKYWSGNLELQKLLDIGSKIRQKNWKKQKDSGIDYIPVGDFAWYDHVLTTSMMLGNIPERHQDINNCSVLNVDCLFRIARGASPNISASEMTKWFNTNYHYIVPEFSRNTTFQFSWKQLLEELDEALSLGYKVKPILLGPITYLWLGKVKEKNFDRLELLSKILPIYQEILQELSKRNIDFVQIDEPVLVLELPVIWQKAYSTAYHQLYGIVKLLLTTYFDSIEHNIHFISKLPIQGIHIDLIHGKYDLDFFLSQIPAQWMISLGIINGRNIWKADLLKWFQFISLLVKKNLDRKFLIGSSCSLLHTPIDVNKETKLTPEIKQCFSFSVQKCIELSHLTTALNTKNINLVEHWTLPLKKYILSNKKNSENIKKRLSSIKFNDLKRISAYDSRYLKQEKKFNFPLFPTTTIGSFPQTSEIRKLRQLFKNKIISSNEYSIGIKRNIKKVIEEQEKLGLDVFVHGEFERNDMVEYFSEHLDGFIFTEYGWVQSYGSRCVKPPIIISDIQRSKPITLKWIKYAQSCTKKPVKGMLTGPVTMLLWSYPREDISFKDTAMQIALALNEEILDLEKEKITIIQIDEPALREGLPLRKSDWKEYLSWAINAFRLSFIGVKDSTQIHTHMCYSEFNDIMKDIALLDADVITIETARSDMELLESFKQCKYPNSIGPGVYDIHSSNIPTVSSINILIKKAIKYIPINRIWVNPDCGLKTRNWDETKLALKNMIEATQKLRKHFTNLS